MSQRQASAFNAPKGLPITLTTFALSSPLPVSSSLTSDYSEEAVGGEGLKVRFN
jgi:hypothetical protein